MRWWTECTGEWGLRFWVVVALERAVFADPAPSRASAVAAGRFRSGCARRALAGRWCVCPRAARPPLLTTSHADLAALEREYETRGYWYLESRGAEGPVVALRYKPGGDARELPGHRRCDECRRGPCECAGRTRAGDRGCVGADTPTGRRLDGSRAAARGGARARAARAGTVRCLGSAPGPRGPDRPDGLAVTAIAAALATAPALGPV